MKYMDLLMIEMNLNYDLNQKYPFLYSVTKNDSFSIHQKFAWFFGLAINLFCLFTLELNKLDKAED